VAAADLIIRDYAPADLARLHEIRAAAFAPVFASFRAIVGERIAPHAFAGDEEAQGRHLEELCGGDHAKSVLVAVIDGQIVGFVGVALDPAMGLGEIGLAAINPNFAGRGIGTALCDFALQRMREAGMKVATVATGGDESHAPARRAYAKAGFDRVLPTQWMYREL
jgi:GNAT superfamily N-acetyltransferase